MFNTPLGIVRVIVEYNCFYGDIITQFEINNTIFTPVKNKYIPTDYLRLSESNSLCGEREFENNSITWEFLLKPLGFDIGLYTGEKKVLFTNFHLFQSKFALANEE